jgi:hypothetical protein
MIRLQDLLFERASYDLDTIKRIATNMGETVTGELGKGANGVAYALESDKVLKVTPDKAEVALATRLRTKRLYKHIANVYDVRKINLPDQNSNSNDHYIILIDRVEPLNAMHRKIWNKIRYDYTDPRISNTNFKELAIDNIETSIDVTLDNEFLQRIISQRAGVLRDFSELRIVDNEAHGSNMGFNQHGSLVHFDAWQYDHYTRLSADQQIDAKRYGAKFINTTPTNRGLGKDI